MVEAANSSSTVADYVEKSRGAIRKWQKGVLRITSEGERPAGHDSRSLNAGSSSPAAIPEHRANVFIAAKPRERPTVRRNNRIMTGLNVEIGDLGWSRHNLFTYSCSSLSTSTIYRGGCSV